MMQLALPDLDSPTRFLARRSDPGTSRAAADRVGEFAHDHYTIILGCLKRFAPRGLTVHEIAAMCRLDAHAVGKRMNELRRTGAAKVAKDGEGNDICREGPSGRRCRVWWPA